MESPGSPTSNPAATLTLCGSLSRYPVSLGVRMHTAGYDALGLPFVYVAFAMTSERLEGALIGMRALGVRGFGVSMPFKLEVMPLLDAISPLASRIGAVNTIVNEDGRLIGHNTDALGAVRALEEKSALRDARVLVLGGGGAARAVAHGLAERGAIVTVSNRTRDKAESVVRDLERASVVAWSDARESALAQSVVVNATSMGMATEAQGEETVSPLEGVRFGSRQIVMDIVYKPLRTRLLEQAAADGATVIDGGRMLLHQAAGQFELYTKHPAPLDAMDAALQATIRGSSEVGNPVPAGR